MTPKRSAKDASASREQARRTFIERMGSIMFETGFPRMPGRVFAALLASDEGRLTAAELAGYLQASPAGISGAVRYLGQIGLVARERERGSRRDHFVLHHDVFHELMAQDVSSLTRWRRGIEEGIDSIGQDTPAGERMAETLEFFTFMQDEIAGMMQRWEQHRARRG